MTVIALWLALSAAWAGKADGVQKLLDLEQTEAARKRCERVGGTLSTAERDLREVCARAFWEETALQDTAAAWLRYQQVWSGTSLAAPARGHEARCALRDIGADADEARYQAFIRSYADTEHAAQAERLLVKAAIREALEDPQQARRVAARFPGHEDVAQLVRAFPDQFLKLSIDGEALSLTVDPPVSLPTPPTARWVAAFPGDAWVEWEQASIAHLLEIGLPRHWIDAAKRSRGLPFVPCPVPDAAWSLGVRIEAAGAQTFVPQPGPEVCRTSWPTFVVVRDGRIAAVSPAPDVLIEVGVPGGDGYADRADGTALWLLGSPAAPLLNQEHLMQSVGSSFLFTPLSGGLPWLESATHASGKLTLTPTTLASVGLPDGWTLEQTPPGGGRGAGIAPGSVATAPVQVRSKAHPGLTWTLPPGEIRVLSPIVAHHTGLQRPMNRESTAPPRAQLPAMGPQGPVGGAALPVQDLGAADRKALSDQLWGLGVPLSVQRGWKVALRPSGEPQVVFEGTVGRDKVRGVLDPSPTSAGWRVHAWKREGPAGDVPLLGTVVGGVRFAAWRSGNGRLEGVWYDDRGLQRQVRSP